MSLEISTTAVMPSSSSTVVPPLDDQRRIVDFLKRRTSYSDVPRGVQVIETHISTVFITDRFVYKLKKPLRYDFLDYSTVERRRAACLDELRLNQRQARGVYLAVLPIWTDTRGQLHLDGREPRGPIVDWVVQMRRLPTERTLDELVHRHLLTEAETQQLAESLARFYAEASPLTIQPEVYRRTIEKHVRANRDALLTTFGAEHGPLVKRVHTAQLRELLTRSEVYDRRVLDGRIIEGHGDLRPEHVCLTSPPVVFDCVEFSAEFRQLDVLDELSFLAMECDRLGARGVGEAVLSAYQQHSGDRPDAELLAFYKAYRATVRAKVAALRGVQVAGHLHDDAWQQAVAYLHLADEYLRPFDRPLLLLVGGMMGSGKSTLAAELSTALGTEWLRSDELRRQMFSVRDEAVDYGAARYQPAARAQVYDELLRQASEHLRDGVSVVLDATFARHAHRQTAVALGQTFQADVIWIECQCPRNTAIERIQARLQSAEPDPSEARPELYDRQAADWEPGELPIAMTTVDTTEPVNLQAAAVYRAVLTSRENTGR